MNCKQVESWLPLYVSHDLAERKARSVAEHLQTCAACSDVLAEYGAARHLLQDVRPPEFSESDYAGIRQGVWRRIEAEPAVTTISDRMAAWFSPAPAWAVAAALLIAISIGGIYFFNRQQSDYRAAIMNAPPMTEPSPVTPAAVDPLNDPTALNRRRRRERQMARLERKTTAARPE